MKYRVILEQECLYIPQFKKSFSWKWWAFPDYDRPIKPMYSSEYHDMVFKTLQEAVQFIKWEVEKKHPIVVWNS